MGSFYRKYCPRRVAVVHLGRYIPTVGTTTKTQLLVSAPEQSVALCEGEPILTVFPETLANDLQCVVNVREYVAAITRYASGTAVITSAAYNTTLIYKACGGGFSFRPAAAPARRTCEGVRLGVGAVFTQLWDLGAHQSVDLITCRWREKDSGREKGS